MPRKEIEKRLTELRDRLALYRQREREMLDANGVKQYSLGSRSLTRYDTGFAELLRQIKALEDEIADLEALKAGCAARRSVGIVPREW
jgi:chromosome segregation ATPase